MSRLEFKPEDFLLYDQELLTPKRIAIRAQGVFEQWLEKQPVVYFSEQFPHILNRNKPPLEHYDTHTARLVDIQEIKKECEHKRIAHWNFDFKTEVTCLDCNKKLKAKWEPA